jgi:hypothetical protein
MKRLVAAVLAFLALASEATAHRLDEYLQATRLDVRDDRLAIELDLTPGTSIAAKVFHEIDRDRDGVVSPHEIEDYARGVLRELVLDVDGVSRGLELTRAECPSWPELRDGMGTIRIEASSAAPFAAAGSHRIRYRNLHRPDISVYLANALVPSSPGVSIVGQVRDVRQQSFDLDIALGGGRSRFGWIFVQGMLVAALLAYRALPAVQLERIVAVATPRPRRGHDVPVHARSCITSDRAERP